MEVSRPTKALYRDLLRLVSHVAPGTTTAKSIALRNQIRLSFKANAGLKDEQQINDAKAAGVRALANYMVLESSTRKEAGGLFNAVKKFKDKDVPEGQGNKKKKNK